MARTIAFGDIHGCSNALRLILDAVAPAPDDLIISLGDVIDRGPDSAGVIAQLLELQQQCRFVGVQGNHEEQFFAALQRQGRTLAIWRKVFEGDATLASYGEDIDIMKIPIDHVDFLIGFVPYFETDSHIFLHANYDPDLSLNQQPGEALRWWPLDMAIMFPHRSGKTVICGHTAQRDGDILDLGFVKCIDTNAGRGGWLSAMHVETGHLWQATDRGEIRQVP